MGGLAHNNVSGPKRPPPPQNKSARGWRYGEWLTRSPAQGVRFPLNLRAVGEIPPDSCLTREGDKGASALRAPRQTHSKAAHRTAPPAGILRGPWPTTFWVGGWEKSLSGAGRGSCPRTACGAERQMPRPVPLRPQQDWSSELAPPLAGSTSCCRVPPSLPNILRVLAPKPPLRRHPGSCPR